MTDLQGVYWKYVYDPKTNTVHLPSSAKRAVSPQGLGVEGADLGSDSRGAMSLTAVGDLDSDARGTGARMNGGKLEFHQLPMFALEGAVRVLMYGAKKYKPGNWLKGQPWTVPYDSAMRHLKDWQRGEDIDPESGEAHLDHALVNLIFLAAYRDIYPEGDNRLTGMRKGGVPKEST